MSGTENAAYSKNNTKPAFYLQAGFFSIEKHSYTGVSEVKTYCLMSASSGK